MSLSFLGFAFPMDDAVHDVMFLRQHDVLVHNLGILHESVQTLLQFDEIPESLLDCMHENIVRRVAVFSGLSFEDEKFVESHQLALLLFHMVNAAFMLVSDDITAIKDHPVLDFAFPDFDVLVELGQLGFLRSHCKDLCEMKEV